MRILRPIVEARADPVPIGGADLIHCRGISAKSVRNDPARRAVFLYDPLEKLQRRGLVPLCRDHSLQDLAFVIDRAPQIAKLTVDLHKDLIQMPCMDAPLAQDGFESFGRVIGCGHVSGLSRPLAGMEMRGPGANQCGEPLSLMAFYCISWPDLSDHLPLPFLDLLTRPTFPWPLGLIVDQSVAATGAR
jgi:hypothetical protein